MASGNLYLAKATRNGRVGLVPTDEITEAEIAKMGDGEFGLFKHVKVRSLPWHRKYFAICREIGQNQDPVRDESSVDMELRVLGGHYDVLMARKGNSLYEVRTPKRIAFDKLTADEWKELYPSLELAGRERFGNEFWDHGSMW